MIVKVKKLHPDAQLPTRACDWDAGADLYSVENISIPPLSRQLVHTGISIELETDDYGLTYARIAPRSGLAHKHGIDVMAGVIDIGYRGEICVVLFNSDKDHTFEVKSGDRIAQLIVEKCYWTKFIDSEELSQSSRSTNGFGSTGIKRIKIT